MFKEFPKCLYLGGNVEALHVVIHSPDEEVTARELGFLNAFESQERATPEPVKRKPGRPAKAKE